MELFKEVELKIAAMLAILLLAPPEQAEFPEIAILDILAVMIVKARATQTRSRLRQHPPAPPVSAIRSVLRRLKEFWETL